MRASNAGGVGRNRDSERIYWLHCVLLSVNAATGQVLPSALCHVYYPTQYSCFISFFICQGPAAVGMGIPMGIPMGMGVGWVWGL